MRAEKRFAIALVKLFAGIKQCVYPGKKLAGSMISVQYDGDTVIFGHIMYMKST
jgi:hypothetical protein